MTTSLQTPSRPDLAAIRKGLAAKGIPLTRLSDTNLRELGVSRAELMGTGVPTGNLQGSGKEAGQVASAKKKPPAGALSTLPAAAFPPAEHSLKGWRLPAYCEPRNLIFKMRLDEETLSNNKIKGMHFAEYKRLREGYEAQVSAALGGYAAPQCERAAVFVVRHCTGKGLDGDNAIGGLKPLLDCLVKRTPRNPSGLHIIEDDGQKNMPYPPLVALRKCPRGQGFTELFVFRLDVSDPGPCVWVGEGGLPAD